MVEAHGYELENRETVAETPLRTEASIGSRLRGSPEA